MTKEQESIDPAGKPVTRIYIDLEDRSALLANKDEPLAVLRLAPEGFIFQAVVRPVPDQPLSDVPSFSPTGGVIGEPQDTERAKPVTLQGKLKSKPREGRPDSRGRPTAWARLAAHEEGHEGAHLYSATFHRHTAKIALSLDRDAQVTVQGYPHEIDDPSSKRLDTFSITNILDYPGKPRRP